MSTFENPFIHCLDPQRIVNKLTGETLVVPCGKCTACSQKKSSRYAFQCDCEAKSSKYVFFVTLTYANAYVPRLRAYEDGYSEDGLSKKYNLFDVTTPRSNTDVSLNYLGSSNYDPALYKELQKKCHLFGDIAYLRKRDIQLFLKTFRDYLSEYEIRYFATGEYGPETFRPHYHFLLYINDSELVEASEVCHMSDFPQWTWPRKKGKVIRPDDKISILEYYIRKTWKYGIVDCEYIKDGTASSYVASYVNGSQPLPSFLTLPATKCFSLHSRFLGRKIFRQELAQVLSTPVESFVRGSVEIGNRVREYSHTYQNYMYYFPKCKGFATLDTPGRLQLYQCYDKAKAIFGQDKSIMSLSRRVAGILSCYVDPKFNQECCFNHYFSAAEKNIVNLIYPFDNLPNPRYQVLFGDDWDKIICNIYNVFLVSRIFCENYKFLKTSPEWYLSRIEEFYNRLDYLHLSDWFESQQKYFLCDYADEHDIVYFYNNTDYDFECYKNSFAYKAFNANVKQLANDMIKHKIANDKNKMFVYG